MNSLKKRLISLVLLTCVALSSFAGCSNNDKSSKKDDSSDNNKTSQTDAATDPAEKTTAAPILDSPIEFVTDENGNFISFPMQSAEIGNVSGGESNSGGLDLNGQDPESIDVSPSIPSSSNSEPATEVVEVTNPQGEPVTDDAGNKTTEHVTVAGTENKAEDYKSVTTGNYILWMDISKNEDFIFNDEFVKITFEVKEGIPDGEYPITFVTDFSTIKGVTLNPTKVINGSITVGGDAKKGEDVSNMSEFVVYGDNVSCKQGETVDFYIRTKNNPGLAATLLWFYYDSNAMTVKTNSVKPAGEFAEISKRLDSNA
ncbi:MAG: hypothetical protein IJY29_02940 [Ruminococcus sp.]|nr:hypothetical protein [Ruminococcus sp.]MBQ9078515.1 hypothetical protein [Ruminococcus sp.]